jgi:hypothetical protein
VVDDGTWWSCDGAEAFQVEGINLKRAGLDSNPLSVVRTHFERLIATRLLDTNRRRTERRTIMMMMLASYFLFYVL